MNVLLATFVTFAFILGDPHEMQPRVLLGGPHTFPCDALTVRDGHIVEESRVSTWAGPRQPMNRVEVKWDGSASTITAADERASEEWMRTHDLLPRLSIKRHDLYWDGKKVDLGRVNVFNIYQAIPWQGGVLIYGRTIPRRGFFGSWPFKGHFIEARDIEPYCAIYFDPSTMKGEDLWLNGKVLRPFFVFPIPR